VSTGFHGFVTLSKRNFLSIGETSQNTMSGDQTVPLIQRRPRLLWPDTVTLGFSTLKVQQRSKIAEIRAALVEARLVALDEQAAALGVSRSTAWSILNPSHKSSGLSARTVSRILRSPRLPGRVRQRMLEYMQEKIEGLYGHTDRRRREFAECLMAALRNEFKLTFERQESDRRRLLTQRPFPVSEDKSRRRKNRSSPGLPRQSV
jgi:ABC-type sugar transport system ATPase subunit